MGIRGSSVLCPTVLAERPGHFRSAAPGSRPLLSARLILLPPGPLGPESFQTAAHCVGAVGAMPPREPRQVTALNERGAPLAPNERPCRAPSKTSACRPRPALRRRSREEHDTVSLGRRFHRVKRRRSGVNLRAHPSAVRCTPLGQSSSTPSGTGQTWSTVHIIRYGTNVVHTI